MHSDHFTWRPGGAPLILQDPWGPSYWFTVFGPPDPKLIIGNVQGGSSAPIWRDPITRILSFIFYDAADTGQFLLHLISRPHHANFVFPLSPPGTPGFGPTVTAALKPGTFTTCPGFGRRLSRHNFSYGPITSAYSLQGAPASPEQIDQILNGGSVSAGFNFNAPGGIGPGGQVTGNGSGVVAGPTVGMPGVSVAATYSGCLSPFH